MIEQEALAAAASALVGVPFRLHGRNPERGLDCVGVLAFCLESIGRHPRLPLHYRLRRTCMCEFAQAATEVGLTPADGTIASGDVLVVRPGPAQFHAGIIGLGGSLIHAHAGLRRVVSNPAPLPWPVEHHWRLSPQ